MDINITKYCHIKDKSIIVNDELVFKNPEAANYNEFIRSVYKFSGMAYPKFYKMDNLSKLALVTSEILLKNSGIIEKYGKENIGVVFQNSSSTIDTDTEFQSTIDDHSKYFPSPSVFVYTLPNIMIGEICIKHKIFGENILMIESEFRPDVLCHQLNTLFEQQRVKSVIAGWIEQNKEHYDAFVYIAEDIKNEKNERSLLLNEENLKLKFNNINN